MAECDKCLEMNPKYAQGWLMKARILEKQTSLAYQEAMQLDASNHEATMGYENMSSDSVEVDEIPNKPHSPPPTRVHVVSVSTPPATCSSSLVSVDLNTASPLLITPPKLFRCPTIALTRIDAIKQQNNTPFPVLSETTSLPPPPPLIKMPISTRKEKRGATSKSSAESEEEKQQEPPRKRTRAGNSESASEIVPPARKIIQEIFGPDKSKKPKGRKRRRGVTTPKKKTPVKQGPHVQEDVGDLDKKQEDEQNEDLDEPVNECEAEAEGSKIEDEEKKTAEEAEQPLDENEVIKEIVLEIKEEQLEETSPIEPQTEEIENVNESEVLMVLDNPPTKTEDISDDNESKNEYDSDSTASFSRVRIGRNAKNVANEKLKKIQQNEAGRSIPVEPEPVVKEEQEEEEEEEKAGEIRSRRSTTEGSSKSSGSIAQAESETSSKQSYIDPHRNSPTPVSVVSDDDDRDMKEDLRETVSISDILDQKDSDVDSTYSWKPVRAAAALALEQVTKNQGGSVVLMDGEAKAAAVAERRARKIQRYKGRNRRTLLFKSSTSKQYTITRKRWSAQPTIIPKIFHHGNYFQAGDIVFVEMEEDTLLHGQISGIMMDHFGEISAGIRWLAPVSPIYALVGFDPKNYATRFDVPEKLVKIEYVNFVMHLNPDYFLGHPSFHKIEKNSIYSRFGRSIHNCTYGSESDSSSDDESNKSKKQDVDSSSDSENERKSVIFISKKVEEDEDSDTSEILNKDTRRPYGIPSGSSTDSTDVEDEEDTTDGKQKSDVGEAVERLQETNQEEVTEKQHEMDVDLDTDCCSKTLKSENEVL
ncbi:unnamed protein product [Orchesella dallaii]|uniref:Uncharacterized protein n=1 Tax=Orchesella dallaii TaxID=48710 RepID=A0ABP1QDN9_9HEXA